MFELDFWGYIRCNIEWSYHHAIIMSTFFRTYNPKKGIIHVPSEARAYVTFLFVRVEVRKNIGKDLSDYLGVRFGLEFPEMCFCQWKCKLEVSPIWNDGLVGTK